MTAKCKVEFAANQPEHIDIQLVNDLAARLKYWSACGAPPSSD